MDPSHISSQPDNFDPAAEVRALKSLFYVALLALIILGVAVDVYLGKQMRLAQRQFLAQRQSVDESERLLRNFAVAMDGFAATNKDFQPVFEKYRSVFGKYLAKPASAQKK
jgi:hypothetical protein